MQCVPTEWRPDGKGRQIVGQVGRRGWRLTEDKAYKEILRRKSDREKIQKVKYSQDEDSHKVKTQKKVRARV